MSAITVPQSPSVIAAETLPPLRSGDHLERETFHQRYEAMPKHIRAELVKGVVIVASPSGCSHGQAHARLAGWLGMYSMQTPGTVAFDNTTTIFDQQNEYQPDVQLVIRPEYGGRGVSLKKYVEGAPQLAIEVAASSESYDLYEKFEVYQQAGVQEYLVVTTTDQQVRWFNLQAEKFQPLSADSQGVFRSLVFPGLWLDSVALFADHPAGLMTTLQLGLADPTHAAFVQQLAQQHLIQQKSSSEATST